MHEMLVFTAPMLREISRQRQRPQGAFVPVFVTINFVTINILPKKNDYKKSLLQKGEGVSVTACTKSIQWWEKLRQKTQGAHVPVSTINMCRNGKKITTKNRENMLKMCKTKLRQDQVRWEAHQVDELELWSSVRVRCREGGREEFESDARACRIN